MILCLLQSVRLCCEIIECARLKIYVNICDIYMTHVSNVIEVSAGGLAVLMRHIRKGVEWEWVDVVWKART
jgi:hypothetical protein